MSHGICASDSYNHYDNDCCDNHHARFDDDCGDFNKACGHHGMGEDKHCLEGEKRHLEGEKHHLKREEHRLEGQKHDLEREKHELKREQHHLASEKHEWEAHHQPGNDGAGQDGCGVPGRSDDGHGGLPPSYLGNGGPYLGGKGGCGVPTLTGDVAKDTDTLEDMVTMGAPPEVLKSFATQVAQEAKDQNNTPYYNFANNIAQSLDPTDGSFRTSRTQKAYNALPDGGAAAPPPTLTGDVVKDTNKLEDMVKSGASPEALQSFAADVAKEAKGQNNTPYYNFANNLAKSLDPTDGSFSQSGTEKAFDALPTPDKATTHGHTSSADMNFAGKDITAYQKFEQDVNAGNKKAIVADLKQAIDSGELSKEDASTLISETGQDFHKGVAKGSETKTSTLADLIYKQDYHGQKVGEGIAYDPAKDRGSARFS